MTTVGDQEQQQADQLRARHSRHMLNELHFQVDRESAATGVITGQGPVTPYLHAPRAARLRTSVLLMWADTLSGLLAMAAMTPAISVTLDLDVHLLRPAPAAGLVRATARPVKQGRTVHVVESEFSDDDGPFAVGTAAFMRSPDASLIAPPIRALPQVTQAPQLSVPLAQRARMSAPAPGVAVLPLSGDGLNSSQTMHGGLLGMAAEEAVLSAEPPGATASSLALRYLSPVRTGPAIATASGQHGLYRAEIRDEGNGGRLAVLAIARTW